MEVRKCFQFGQSTACSLAVAIATFLLTIGFAVPGKAVDGKGLYQTLHYISCAAYIQDRKDLISTGVDQVYISGWLSAYNYLTPNTYDILPESNISMAVQWLDKFCAENPLKSIEAGLLQLTDELYPKRIQNYTAPAASPPDATAEPKK